MNVKVLFLCAVLVAVSGCAQSRWAATGGSRSDATVDVSYEIQLFGQPPKSDAEAHQIAVQRCQSWGYADAEAFGGVKRTIIDEYSSIYTKTFQCIGQGTETATKADKSGKK